MNALITGITGQDGSYLSELLLSKGYTVHGIVRRSSSFNTERINHLYAIPTSRPPPLLHYGDLTDSSVLRRIIEKALPDEIYNLGAQSHVKVSFELPEYTADTDALGTLRLLEAVRDHIEHTGRRVRFYQAGSSEMFGAAPPRLRMRKPRSTRAAPMRSRRLRLTGTPSTTARLTNLFVSNGILFNHESPRRGETFVTRKITRAVARIRLGLQDKLFLGNLDAKRDWGFAGDYVEAMWLMLQQPEPDDFVIATGKSSPFASSSKKPPHVSISTGAASLKSIPSTSARRKSTTCWEIPPRRVKL